MANSKSVLLIGSSVDGKVTVNKGGSSKLFGKLLSKRMNAPIIELRKWADAIVTSRSTVLIDNPSLCSSDNQSLVRCVIDRKLQLPLTRQFFNGKCKTIVFTLKQNYQTDKAKKLMSKGVIVETLRQDNFLKSMKSRLHEMGLHHLLFEGGGEFNRLLIDNHIVDELKIAYFPFVIGGKNTPTICDGDSLVSIADATKLSLIRSYVIGGQMVVNTYKIVR
jgi:riboflavin-specific deaminase-like protein